MDLQKRLKELETQLSEMNIGVFRLQGAIAIIKEQIQSDGIKEDKEKDENTVA